MTHEEYLEGEARCRRLAASIADEKVRQQLLTMADEYAARAASLLHDDPPREANGTPLNVARPQAGKPG